MSPGDLIKRSWRTASMLACCWAAPEIGHDVDHIPIDGTRETFLVVTGHVSSSELHPTKWTCIMVPDGRLAWFHQGHDWYWELVE